MSKTITVNINEEIEDEFRKKAALKYGKRKGYLGKAMTEAMDQWMRNLDSDIEVQSLLMLKEGIKMKKWNFEREDLYER
ncbi:MAG: hypothetical protein ACYDAO_08610 [Thermoplasmataceae archaeon]